MFTQSATKEIRNGKIHGGGATSMGAVYQWNKVHSGNAGLSVKFKTFASKGDRKISFESNYTVNNTMSDNVTMNVAERGTVDQEGSGWTIFKAMLYYPDPA